MPEDVATLALWIALLRHFHGEPMPPEIRQYFTAPAIGGPRDGQMLVHTATVLPAFNAEGRLTGCYIYRFAVPLPDGTRANRWLWRKLASLSA